MSHHQDHGPTLGSTNGNSAEPDVENAWLRQEVTRLEARSRRAEDALESMRRSLADLVRDARTDPHGAGP
ncbi:MAG: hypothetical protein QOE65_2900 [Solirubrobacteraceae bacterium]|jgi:hypothetical protein|nr:hypothetical protein [Solirubrobacteraceae bacterium]